MLSRDDVDALRREISEVFWSYLHRDGYNMSWIEAFLNVEKRGRIEDDKQLSPYIKKLRSDLEEVETAVDQIYFALLKYPKDLVNHLAVVPREQESNSNWIGKDEAHS